MKLKNEAITKVDIDEYLENYSDFSFEIKVLKKFISAGFSCQHAGTYEDPVTSKTREFDIRAFKSINLVEGTILNFCFSIECKNLRDNFPLVIHCMPRIDTECYLDLIWSSYPESFVVLYRFGKSLRLERDNGPYKENCPVGKSCDQVGRRIHDNCLTGNDFDVYDKISQAVNSSYDIVKDAHYACKKDLDVISLVIPILVVPDSRLWTVGYNGSGDIEQAPQQSKNIEYFLGKKWTIDRGRKELPASYWISHLEVVQFGEIENVIKKYYDTRKIASMPRLRKTHET
jgi:hypothetical protein